jgi:hypothetical protein
MNLTPARIVGGLKRLARKQWLLLTRQDVDILSLNVDFRGLTGDALDARRRAAGLRFLIDLPFSRLRDMHPIVPDWPSNPFVLTAQALLETDGLSYADSPLCSYFDHVAPANAAAVAGSTSSRLKDMKAIEADLPWMPFGPPAAALKQERSVRQARENNAALTFADGDYAMGPVSVAKGELELARIRQVLRSIIETGYRPGGANNHINGYLITDTEDWALMIDSGTHRAACLYALGHTTVPVLVKVERTVRRQDVDTWRNVKDGLLSRDEALAFFDRVLRGGDPDWLATCWPPGTRQRGAGSRLPDCA